MSKLFTHTCVPVTYNLVYWPQTTAHCGYKKAAAARTNGELMHKTVAALIRSCVSALQNCTEICVCRPRSRL